MNSFGHTFHRRHRPGHDQLGAGVVRHRRARGDGAHHSRSRPAVGQPDEVEERTLLPSFLYLPGELDFPPGALALPWEREPQVFAGELARKRGAETRRGWSRRPSPGSRTRRRPRVAPSCRGARPRRCAKLSPVEASADYLRHLVRRGTRASTRRRTRSWRWASRRCS